MDVIYVLPITFLINVQYLDDSFKLSTQRKKSCVKLSSLFIICFRKGQWGKPLLGGCSLASNIHNLDVQRRFLMTLARVYTIDTLLIAPLQPPLRQFFKNAHNNGSSTKKKNLSFDNCTMYGGYCCGVIATTIIENS